MYTLSYEEALERYRSCESSIELCGCLTDEELGAWIPMGIWEHFKSVPDDPKFYAVQGAGRDVDDGPYRAIYQALYGMHRGKVAFRQLIGPNPKTGVLDGFLLPVDRESYRGPRFRLVAPARDLRHLQALAEQYLLLTAV